RMVAKVKPTKRVSPADEAVTPIKKVKKEVKEVETPKVEKKIEKKVKVEPAETPKQKKQQQKKNKVTAELPAKKEKKSEEEEAQPVKQEQTEQKGKKKDNKKKNKAAQPVVAVKVEQKEVEEDAYVPGAISALFGLGGEAAAASAETKSDIFAKYADVDNGFVDVPTVIGAVEKKEEKTDENSRKKQRENRKKNADERALVDERKRTIFVGNLPVDCTRKQLEALFAGCGKIDSARLRGTVGSKETLSKKTAFLSGKINENIKSIIGYVKFVDAATVAEAIKKNGTVMDGHHLRVDGCVGSKNYERKATIFVGNLPFEIRDDELLEWAETCVGPVEFVRVVRDRNTGYGKGIGFINFKDSSSITAALALTNPVIGTNEVRLSKVMKKSEKKDLKKGDAARTALRKQKKLDKKAGLRGAGKLQQQRAGGAAGGGAAGAARHQLPANPLLPKPTRPSRKVQKEIMKRKKMSGPKSLMK
ncbi:hypothetical protein PFISCL1PPCAC_17545, partial [Pristionchus fissidentatus]